MSKQKFLVIDNLGRVNKILTNPPKEVADGLNLVPLTPEIDALIKKGISPLDLCLKDGNIVVEKSLNNQSKGVSNIPQKYQYDDTKIKEEISDIATKSGLKYFELKSQCQQFSKQTQEEFEKINKRISMIYEDIKNQTHQIKEKLNFHDFELDNKDEALNKFIQEIKSLYSIIGVSEENLKKLYIGLSTESLENIKKINKLNEEKDLLQESLTKLAEEFRNHKEEPVKSNNKLILFFSLALIISTVLGIIF